MRFSYREWKSKLTWRNFTRTLKYQYIKLLKSKGGAKKVALGFAMGFGLEMLVPTTVMLIYVTFYPLARVTKTPLTAMIVGNVIGKLTTLPLLLVPLGLKLGHFLAPHHPRFVPHPIFFYIQGLLGMSVLAVITGFLSYFVAYFLYEANRKRRLHKMELNRQKNAQLAGMAAVESDAAAKKDDSASDAKESI